LLCKRITRCSRTRVEVVRHFAKFGDRRHASISFRPTCFGATPQNPDWVPLTPLSARKSEQNSSHPDVSAHSAIFSRRRALPRLLRAV
jgi:hypothetical protein